MPASSFTTPLIADSTPHAAAIPHRHGADRLRAERAARMILRQLPAAARTAPSPEQWAQLGAGLLRGDAPADALANWLQSTDSKAGWALIGQALEQGIDSLEAAPAPLKAFFSLVEARPAWVQDELLAEGARVCALGGLAGMRTLLVTGLLVGYQLAAINQTLLATGALEKGAARRIAETTKWWADVTSEGAMHRFASGFKNTVRVRLIHALVRQQVGEQATWEVAELGVPVCQTDMQATYLAFSVVYLLGMQLIGVRLSCAEREAVMHLWRYIAWVNGVEEDFLHDLVEGESSGLGLLYRNLLSQRMADQDSARLAQALIAEPLGRNYKSWSWLQGRYNRSLQLSIARACMDNASLRSLGLPVGYLPWYPLLMIPFNRLLHGLARCVPGGRDWLIRRGRAQQANCLALLFGARPPELRDIAAVKLA